MNITPHTTAIPIPTVTNPSTDALRRENHQREVITQPAAAQQSASEKGVASEREKARTPAQQNQQIDFAEIQKKIAEQHSTISDEDSGSSEQREQSKDADSQDKESTISDDSSTKDKQRAEELAQQQKISELRARDREVKAHEQAHMSAGGVATGSPSYSFEVGPDGKKYAVEGEVSVDLGTVKGNPRATITKMQKVYNAALAPANPSIQDMRVANSAARIIAQAQSQLLEQITGASEDESTTSSNFPESTHTKNRDSFEKSGAVETENDFDQFINQTLASQQSIVPDRTQAIDARAHRIENFYADINHAYEKPSNSQFELTA